MKRSLAVVIALLLILAIPLAITNAAGDAQKGDLLITQEPEKVQGAVGEIVKVDFFLYPNLPDGLKLDTFQCTMKYDQEFLTLGAINQVDDEKKLTSFMKSKGPLLQCNIEQEKGLLLLGFLDMYGVEEEGFWFQAEFRIEKEGATDFVFNGFEYTGIPGDGDYKAVRFVIDPVSVGGVYTEGHEVPTDQPEETYAPLTPAVDTPAPPTDTPKPSGGGQSVPIVSKLPTYSPKPTPSGIVTPPPPVTSIPMVTPEQKNTTSVPQQNTDTPAPAAQTTPDPEPAPTTEVPVQTAETTPFPIGDNVTTEATSEPTAPVVPETAKPVEEPAAEQTPEKTAEEKTDMFDIWLIVGIVAGMVAVLGLGAVAIALLMKRRKMNDRDRD